MDHHGAGRACGIQPRCGSAHCVWLAAVAAQTPPGISMAGSSADPYTIRNQRPPPLIYHPPSSSDAQDDSVWATTQPHPLLNLAVAWSPSDVCPQVWLRPLVCIVPHSVMQSAPVLATRALPIYPGAVCLMPVLPPHKNYNYSSHWPMSSALAAGIDGRPAAADSFLPGYHFLDNHHVTMATVAAILGALTAGSLWSR